MATTAARGTKRTAGQAFSAGKEVLVCGKRYAGLSWFLGKPNPAPSQCSKARSACGAGALEVKGGHVRALDVAGYAVAPTSRQSPQPLCGERQRLGGEWVDTQIEGVQVRRAQQPVASRLSQVLFLVPDLEREFR